MRRKRVKCNKCGVLLSKFDHDDICWWCENPKAALKFADALYGKLYENESLQLSIKLPHVKDFKIKKIFVEKVTELIHHTLVTNKSSNEELIYFVMMSEQIIKHEMKRIYNEQNAKVI